MGKLLSCAWKICINGKELDINRKKCIESIEIQEQCDGSDTCTLKVNDPNFLYIEDNIFLEEATVTAELGWHGDTHRVNFTGYISAIDIDFPESGSPVLSVFCLDNSHVMNRKKKQRSWDNVTRAEVIEKVAKEYGFNCVTETGYTFTKEDTISQSDITDIEFCESLAREEKVPFMCKLIETTLYYVKKGILKDPTSTLYYKKFPYDVVSFSPRITKETLEEGVTASDIDTSSKTVDSHTATSSNTSRDTQGDAVETTSTPTGSTSTTSTSSRVYDPKTGKWVTVN